MSHPRGAPLCLAVLSSTLVATPALAQSYRGFATTSVQVVELLPLGADTIPRSDVLTDANGRFFYQGFEVTCASSTTCTGYLPGGKVASFAATQDISLSFWGLGVQGLSVTTLVRVRAKAGSDFVWPRSDDEFDALLGYAQLERGAWRFRAGRLELRSGLGFSGFDGGSASYARGSWMAEVYGGRSLARGLREPENEALRGPDSFMPDKSAVLLGGSVGGRVGGSEFTGRYQREILSNRSSLVSERASFDFSSALPRVRVTGSLDYDFSFQHIGKGHLTLSAPIADGEWLVELSGQRYVPYFELSTIWGFFEPVSYSEVLVRAAWSPGSTLGVWASGGWRSYGDTETTVVLEPMRDTGWRADAGARWQLATDWALDGRYELEWGPGGFLNSGDAAVRFSPTERLAVSVHGMTFQQIAEYRLGEGRAFGGGASADFRATGRIWVSGGTSVVRHRDGGTIFTSPWNQARAWTSLRFDVGQDPGLANRRRAR